MDLAVLPESPLGSQSSSRVGACTCAFLPSSSSSVTLPIEWIKGSVAFPRGFPTGLSHVPTWCESILGLKVAAVQGKQVSLNGLRHLGDSGNGGTTLEFLSTYDRDFRNPLWWPQERPVPMRVARGTLGIPLPSMPGPKTWCGVSCGT